MRYKDLSVNYEIPFMWRRPEVEKLPKKGKTFQAGVKEEEDFKKLREGAQKEIVGAYDKAIASSNSIGEMNTRISDLSDFYSKAIIPSNEVDPGFLLNKTNKNTLNKKLQPWCQNLVYNIPEIIKSKPYDDLRDKFKDVPAFVVMAGPSLKNNREKLKRAKGKSLIICVDTSLRPLLDIGVVPDICVTHDANPNGCKFFLAEDHPLNVNNTQLNDMSPADLGMVMAQLIQDKDRLKFKYDTLGLFVNYCNPLTLLTYNGSGKRFYGVLDPSLPVYDMMAACSNYKHDDEKGLMPENKGRVIGGSSVGHVAMYIAIALGCNPVSLLGLDLSYPGGVAYVDGASNNKDLSKQRLIDMDDLSGNKVKTNLSMLSYKMVFERSFPQIIMQKPELKFYNCTEDDKGKPAGILEIGANPRSIDSVIEQYCTKDIDLSLIQEKGGDLSE